MSDPCREITAWRTAQWRFHEFDNALTLEIELGNDRAITLTCWTTGDPPSVGLWFGSGEHSFVRTDRDPGEHADRFRAWLDAVGPVTHG
jgi:hypothetical protein